MSYFYIGNRPVGEAFEPLVIAEIGINHEGSYTKAQRMVRDAAAVGCECVKFQCHVVDDEMIPNDVIPGNAKESIWEIMSRCALSEDEDCELKDLTERLGMLYLSTPFSRAAANRLRKMDIQAYKIGSGECNNYPLVQHIATFGKPIILSTGMNDLDSIAPAVSIIRNTGIPFALMHCTSMYPTPYDKVRLGAITELRNAFPDAVLGSSDHSVGNWTCFAAISFGARIVEKHFTSNRDWPGPDVSISIVPEELKELVEGTKAIFASMGGSKTILKEEEPTINFAYACVVATREIMEGEIFDSDSIWVKRPGTGEIKAKHYHEIIGKRASRSIHLNTQLTWNDIK